MTTVNVEELFESAEMWEDEDLVATTRAGRPAGGLAGKLVQGFADRGEDYLDIPVERLPMRKSRANGEVPHDEDSVRLLAAQARKFAFENDLTVNAVVKLNKQGKVALRLTHNAPDYTPRPRTESAPEAE